MFGEAGRQSEFGKIRDCLDSGSPEKIPGSMNSILEALQRLLDSFEEPVVPYEIAERLFSFPNDLPHFVDVRSPSFFHFLLLIIFINYRKGEKSRGGGANDVIYFLRAMIG